MSKNPPGLTLEIGLDIIHKFLPPELASELSLQDIADICGVDRSYIYQLEKKVLKKLKLAYDQ